MKTIFTVLLRSLLAYLFAIQILHAQENEYELLKALPHAQGKEKIDILVKLSFTTNDIGKAKEWATETLALAQTTDYKDGIAAGYICLGNTSKYLIYNVIATDSLEGIAQKYETTIGEIVKNSHLLNEALFEGQTLQIVTPKSRVEAENYFLKALEIRKLQNFANGQIWAYQRLAELAKDGDEWDKAEKYYVEIIKIRENNFSANQGEVSALRTNLLSVADFYFARYLREKVPSERNYFLQKEEEMRNKFLDWAEKTAKSKHDFQVEILNTADFYWKTRKQMGKAEKYLKRAIKYTEENKIKDKYTSYSRAWSFYKEQGKTYFKEADFEKAEQFFKNYIQTVQNYYAKSDTFAYNRITEAHFLVADFYEKNGNTIGSEIYTLKGAYTRLKQKNVQKLKWLINRLGIFNLPSTLIEKNIFANEKLDYSFKDLTKQLYKEDFEAILANLYSVNEQQIKKLMIQKVLGLGEVIGENNQMLGFYSQSLKSQNLDVETKLDLTFKLAQINENHGNTSQSTNDYKQIIQWVENEKSPTFMHYFYLAKAYKALNNKQKAMDFARKALQNLIISKQKIEKTVLLRAKMRDMLAQLLKFDDVSDTTFIVHTVAKGERLNDIQSLYDVNESCLIAWNFLENKELIEGMKIKVCKKTDWIRSRKANEALPPNTYFYHVLNHGETLQSIAQRYQKTIEQLQAENNNALTSISIGQKIGIGKYFMQCACEE
jgi:LysM repeat protein